MTWDQKGNRHRYADATGKVFGTINETGTEFDAWYENVKPLGLYTTLLLAQGAIETAYTAAHPSV